MALTIYVFILFISTTYCSDHMEPDRRGESDKIAQADDNNSKQNEKGPPSIINIKGTDKNQNKNAPIEPLVTTPKTSDGSNIKSDTNTDVETGAVLRGVFVFVVITLLFIMYLTCKTYRKRNKKNILIKKYGVRTRRTDVEMEPLPLDDDEEDDTVFDLGNVNNR